jgi:hypothetical protein
VGFLGRHLQRKKTKLFAFAGFSLLSGLKLVQICELLLQYTIIQFTIYINTININSKNHETTIFNQLFSPFISNSHGARKQSKEKQKCPV